MSDSVVLSCVLSCESLCWMLSLTSHPARGDGGGAPDSSSHQSQLTAHFGRAFQSANQDSDELTCGTSNILREAHGVHQVLQHVRHWEGHHLPHTSQSEKTQGSGLKIAELIEHRQLIASNWKYICCVQPLGDLRPAEWWSMILPGVL